MSRQPRGCSSRLRYRASLDDDERRQAGDAEAADEVGPLVLVDDEHAERAVVAAPLQHLGEESLHPAALAGERRGEEDQARLRGSLAGDGGLDGRHASTLPVSRRSLTRIAQ